MGHPNSCTCASRDICRHLVRWWQAAQRADCRRALTRLSVQVSDLTAQVGLVRAQIALQKHSSLPASEVRARSAEIKQIRTIVSETSPAFWPCELQIVNLLSKATSTPQPRYALTDLTGVFGDWA